MHIWTEVKWKKHLNENNRTGLRLRFENGVNTEVKRACMEFCQWLRKEYYFPQRVVIYFKKSEKIKAQDGDMVSATFLGPYDRNLEPYIRVSTGDYEEILARRGKDNALAAILMSVAHELTHYYQWVNDIELTNIGEERQAKNYASFIID